MTVGYKDLNPAATLKGWKVDEKALTASTTAPEAGAQVKQLQYCIDDGLFDPSRASVLVRGVKGCQEPADRGRRRRQARPGESTALVDVLANDTDIDCDAGPAEGHRRPVDRRRPSRAPRCGSRSSTTPTPFPT